MNGFRDDRDGTASSAAKCDRGQKLDMPISTRPPLEQFHFIQALQRCSSSQMSSESCASPFWGPSMRSAKLITFKLPYHKISDLRLAPTCALDHTRSHTLFSHKRAEAPASAWRRGGVRGEGGERLDATGGEERQQSGEEERQHAVSGADQLEACPAGRPAGCRFGCRSFRLRQCEAPVSGLC
ncbi:uncharacterized protein PITG_17563 [Phytophthora infestans T30-4]|uniref:Uncharacterized protein n=1 Tax=Phytophthora infestans (strain T30-4) TaxID=403677 RepID=D0NWN7_PHYIT|nr:uncharacterized protein PITG_17563 [Phytophthora infestans T30-4]EEY67470.1 hypothetical protein PITG_17563 [Phytophthora infestans T30-4]|eukprot:XP_002896443.1 hypothetical protein PITG_17563 [Phytophthora infestans T30-4]